MPQQNRPSIYDSLRPLLDAEDLVSRLGLTVEERSGPELYCRPLCHESTSGTSLHINTDTGVWLCRACEPNGIRGDLFGLVEYAQTNGQPPTTGDGALQVPSHREAIRWLALQYGIPFEEGSAWSDAALDAVHMVAVSARDELMRAPEVLDWIREKWGFDQGIAEQYGLGYLSPQLMDRLDREARSRRSSAEALSSAGVGYLSRETGRFSSGFERRVTFPYLEGGRAVYLIGRETPWTPAAKGGKRAAKYRKLPVHDAKKRPWISETITNDHLFNEQALRGGGWVVIAEGIADAVALSAIGVPVISPVTVSVNRVDIERIQEKASVHGVEGFEILFDNELSGIGLAGAMRTAEALMSRGFPVKILELPLGPKEEAARDEVLGELGAEPFERLQHESPIERKKLLETLCPDPGRREWLQATIEAAKVDVAEWYAREGPNAAEAFRAIQAAGRDAFVLIVEERTRNMDREAFAETRLRQLAEVIELAARLESVHARKRAASIIAQRAGKGITKREIESLIAERRRAKVKPERKAEEDGKAAQERAALPPLSLGPVAAPAPSAPMEPMTGASSSSAAAPVPSLPFGGSEPPAARPGAPAAPRAPTPHGGGGGLEGELDRYRGAVAQHVKNDSPERTVGLFIAQVIVERLGWMPFEVEGEIVLVKGRESVRAVARGGSGFIRIVAEVSGISSLRGKAAKYVDATVIQLAKMATRQASVSWSHVSEGAVFWHLGSDEGDVLRIGRNSITPTTAAQAKVPVVGGKDFQPITYTHGARGIGDVFSLLRYVSISDASRLLLTHWIAALPILRLVGCVPILRIEGGSGSGKTRAVEVVGHLVNGGPSSSVPTPAAMTSRLSRDMLTVDDNRESKDITPSFQTTLLQAPHLGAREKRKGSTDTGVVVERFTGALLMNGIEPIHAGKGEIASRMLLVESDSRFHRPGSPTRNRELVERVGEIRDAFWSEAAERCAVALELDARFGDALGEEIRELMKASRLGRLAPYLRIMYLVAVAGAPRERWAELAPKLSPVWVAALSDSQGHTLESLAQEEITVQAITTILSYARKKSLKGGDGIQELRGLDDKYVLDSGRGVEYLTDMSARQLSRYARFTGRELNAPREITHELTTTQLEARLLDGRAYLEEAGIAMDVTSTNKRRHRFAFARKVPTSSVADGFLGTAMDDDDAGGFLEG